VSVTTKALWYIESHLSEDLSLEAWSRLLPSSRHGPATGPPAESGLRSTFWWVDTTDELRANPRGDRLRWQGVGNASGSSSCSMPFAREPMTLFHISGSITAPASIRSSAQAGRGEHPFSVRVAAVVDFIQVAEYVWKAGLTFHPAESQALDSWVRARLLEVLRGHASDVAAGMRRSATLRSLTAADREPVDACADYLLTYAPYLTYHIALSTGLPIATGVIANQHVPATAPPKQPAPSRRTPATETGQEVRARSVPTSLAMRRHSGITECKRAAPREQSGNNGTRAGAENQIELLE
jgi:hypothetical protein